MTPRSGRGGLPPLCTSVRARGGPRAWSSLTREVSTVPPDGSVDVLREPVPRRMNVSWEIEVPGLLEKGLRGHIAPPAEGHARRAAPRLLGCTDLPCGLLREGPLCLSPAWDGSSGTLSYISGAPGPRWADSVRRVALEDRLCGWAPPRMWPALRPCLPCTPVRPHLCSSRRNKPYV